MHKRLYGGKSDISGACPIPSLRFQVVQEVHDQRRIELLKVQFGRGNFETFAGVFKEEFECVGIGLAGVFAGTALDGQALLKEGRDMGSDWSHGRPPVKKLSQHCAMFFINSGTASRYQ